MALAGKFEKQNTRPGISQHPRQVTSDHRLARAALLHMNGNGLHALPTPIRIVVPMVIAAIVVIGSRVATRLLIRRVAAPNARITAATAPKAGPTNQDDRSEEHTSALQSLMRISYAVLYLTKQKVQDKS